MMLRQGLHVRVTKLETDVAAIGTDVKDVQSAVLGLGDKIDGLFDRLGGTRELVRAGDVEVEGRIRKWALAMLSIAISLIVAMATIYGAISIAVSGIFGPYKEKIEQTATSTADTIVKIGAIREVLAEQGADVGRNRDSIEIAREKNRLQDAELREHDQELSFMKGVMSAKGWPTH